MRLILDVDGPCADFVFHLKDYMGLRKKLHEMTSYEITEFMTKDELEIFKYVMRDSVFWSTLPVVTGAKEGVAAAQAAGWEVLFATAPWLTCPTWGHVRHEWLKKHFGASPRAILIGANKSVIKGDLFVDDKPKNVTEWAVENPTGRACLYDTPHNRNQNETFNRVTWKEINAIIASKAP